MTPAELAFETSCAETGEPPSRRDPSIKTTMLKEEAGVRLTRVETLSGDNLVTSAHWTVSGEPFERQERFTDVKRATRAFWARITKSCGETNPAESGLSQSRK